MNTTYSAESRFSFQLMANTGAVESSSLKVARILFVLPFFVFNFFISQNSLAMINHYSGFIYATLSFEKDVSLYVPCVHL